jgi:hypothetical protein
MVRAGCLAHVRRKFNHSPKLDPKDREAAGGVTFGRVTLQPGWKWSTCVKPIAKTESCQALLPPGHDAWVVGDEPFVAIDIQGMTHYEEPPKKA